MEQTYWNQQGKYQSLYEELFKLIPIEGSVKNPTKNKMLERFRKACNAYYDLYNNGLGNRTTSFTKLFQISGSMLVRDFKFGLDNRFYMLESKINEKMDQFILEAAKEQNIQINP